MFKKRGQGQSWSLDIIIAFVVFVLIIGIFYALLGNNKKDKTNDLALESNAILSNLDAQNGQNTELTIIDKGNIDSAKVEELYSSDYSALKRQFGIRGEFCIYMVDQYGNLVTVDKSGSQVNGFGNGNYSINGQPCGSTVS
jgi:hypothetical protein